LSIVIIRFMEAYLLLGSNIGDRRKNIENALLAIGEKNKIVKVSSLYETESYGYKDQPYFINCCCKIETKFSPRELLIFVKEIEKKMGRKNGIRWGPRNIDIDILFYSNIVINEKDLIIPHYDLANRKFVLICLSEIAPYFVHPVLKKTVKEMFDEIKDLCSCTLLKES